MVTRSSKPPPIDQKVLEAVTTGYYSQLLTAGSTGRARAQAAYTVASATAAALVAAGVLTGISTFPAWVQFFGWMAVVAWLFTAAVFMWISRKAPPFSLPPEGADLTARTFVEFALGEAVTDALQVEKELRQALISASIALVLTTVAFAAALLTAAATLPSTLFFTDDGQGWIATACPEAESTEHLFGGLESDTLDDSFVVLHKAAGFCLGKDVVLRIPRTFVESVRSPAL